jgi:phosphoribosylamine-glycine ligase
VSVPYTEGDIWICKPVGMNQGKGIYLVRNLEEFKKSLDEREDKLKQKTGSRHMDRIIQRLVTQQTPCVSFPFTFLILCEKNKS